MRQLLLIDNDSDTLIELRQLCDSLDFAVTIVHRSEIGIAIESGYDLIVLSGGYWYDDELQHLNNYAAELALIRRSLTPIIGICLGMQLLHTADRGIVPLMNEAQTGRQAIRLTAEGVTTLHLGEHLVVSKNHTRSIAKALPHYMTLGVSTTGLEIIKHRQRPLIGVQFHPELEEAAQGKMLMQTLIHATAPTLF